MSHSPTKMLEQMQALTEAAFEKAIGYFKDPSNATENDAQHVQAMLKAAGNYSRIMASETNRMAITLGAFKMMGLKGEALHELWQDLTGQQAAKFLPTARESDNAALPATSEKQGLSESTEGANH
jgi:hypothetical protein